MEMNSTTVISREQNKHSMVVLRFLHWLLVDGDHGVIRYAAKDGRAAIEQVGGLLQRTIDGGVVSEEEWEAVADGAYRYDTGAAANKNAAYAAAEAANHAADYAINPTAEIAYSYDSAAADEAAEAAAYATDASGCHSEEEANAVAFEAKATALMCQRDMLLRLLREGSSA